MSAGFQSPLTKALSLVLPWYMVSRKLDINRWRIDFFAVQRFDNQLRRRIAYYFERTRVLETRAGVALIDIGKTGLHRGQYYLPVVNDLDAKRLLFATEGRGHLTMVLDSIDDLKASGGDHAKIHLACMDKSEAYTIGVAFALSHAQIIAECFHVIAMAMATIDKERWPDMTGIPVNVHHALGTIDRRGSRQPIWEMHQNRSGWSAPLTKAMHRLHHARLKSTYAWQLKMRLHMVHARAMHNNSIMQAGTDLQTSRNWARRSQLEPLKNLATRHKRYVESVAHGTAKYFSNAYAETTNGILQHAKRAARALRTSRNFIHIACLRMWKATHLSMHLFERVTPR